MQIFLRTKIWFVRIIAGSIQASSLIVGFSYTFWSIATQIVHNLKLKLMFFHALAERAEPIICVSFVPSPITFVFSKLFALVALLCAPSGIRCQRNMWLILIWRWTHCFTWGQLCIVYGKSSFRFIASYCCLFHSTFTVRSSNLNFAMWHLCRSNWFFISFVLFILYYCWLSRPSCFLIRSVTLQQNKNILWHFSS